MTPKQHRRMILECERKQAKFAALRAEAAKRTPKGPNTQKQKPEPVYKSEYEAYINSGKWRLFKITIFAQRGPYCERCGSCRRPEVHHKTYARLFNELPEDVEVLCRKCHSAQHGIIMTEPPVHAVPSAPAKGVGHLARKWKR
jgi:hypothetical protein